jgi:SSS family solute:Na+ symporter
MMATAQGNLVTRNIIKKFKPDLSGRAESNIVKWSSAVLMFIFLRFVFTGSSTYAIRPQLLGGVIILQLLQTLLPSLYTNYFKKEADLVGLFIGLFMAFGANIVKDHSTGFNSSLYGTPIGSVCVGVGALVINLMVTAALSAVIPRREVVLVPQPQAKQESQDTLEA